MGTEKRICMGAKGCGQLKLETEFPINGKDKTCKACRTKSKVKIPKTFVCENCNKGFTHYKPRKHCFDCCEPHTKHTLADCLSKAPQCISREDYTKKFPREMGWLRYNQHLPDLYAILPRLVSEAYTKPQCQEAAANYETLNDFAIYCPYMYRKATSMGWMPDIGPHLIRQNSFSLQDCLDFADECDFYSDFTGSPQWAKCCTQKWLPIIREILPRNGHTPFTRTYFKHKCEKHGGYGTIYLIKCYDDDEMFYKIGITSQSIEKRYASETLPYVYDVVWYIESDPDTIFNLEWDYKRYLVSSKMKYSPEIKFGGSAYECFKCHGNCKILQEPA